MIIDLLVCVGFPLFEIVLCTWLLSVIQPQRVLTMNLDYFVQGHRYNILEQIGCYPAIYNTLPAYFIIYMWPIVLGSISAVYCCMSLYFYLTLDNTDCTR